MIAGDRQFRIGDLLQHQRKNLADKPKHGFIIYAIFERTRKDDGIGLLFYLSVCIVIDIDTIGNDLDLIFLAREIFRHQTALGFRNNRERSKPFEKPRKIKTIFEPGQRMAGANFSIRGKCAVMEQADLEFLEQCWNPLKVWIVRRHLQLRRDHEIELLLRDGFRDRARHLRRECVDHRARFQR